jgi:succinate---hydroxymethylglutarate CoA-transferase
LGDMGAEVIKIEQPGGGDETRRWGPPFVEGESSYFMSINRNKKSVAVNLQSERGLEIIYDLVKKSDIVVQNFLPGKADELGVGYETLAKMNPRIIYCSISGFGVSGPLSSKPGYDLICSAMYGMMHITGPEGHCDETVAVRPAVAVTDISCGLMAHGAILAALFERTHSNVGQHVDTSLMETHLATLVPNAGVYLTGGTETMHRWGSGNSTIVPYQVFYCGDNNGLAIAVGSDKQFQLLCEAMEVPHLLQGENVPKFKTNASRVKHRKELVPLLEAQFRTKSRSEWEAVFAAQESQHKGTTFPYGPLRKISEAFACEQAVARDMVMSVPNHKKIPGSVNLVGHAVKYSRTPCSAPADTLPPPVLGQHTNEVLSSLCALDESELAELRGLKAIQ